MVSCWWWSTVLGFFSRERGHDLEMCVKHSKPWALKINYWLKPSQRADWYQCFATIFGWQPSAIAVPILQATCPRTTWNFGPCSHLHWYVPGRSSASPHMVEYNVSLRSLHHWGQLLTIGGVPYIHGCTWPAALLELILHIEANRNLNPLLGQPRCREKKNPSKNEQTTNLKEASPEM